MKKGASFFVIVLVLALGAFVVGLTRAVYESIRETWSADATMIIALAIGGAMAYIAIAITNSLASGRGNSGNVKLIEGESAYPQHPVLEMHNRHMLEMDMHRAPVAQDDFFD